MRYAAFYVIRPNEKLTARLAEMSTDYVERLSGATLWKYEQGGRAATGLDDYLHTVKCLFVANLKFNVSTESEYGQLFGRFPTSSEEFDKWWDVEVFQGYDEDVREVASNFTKGSALDELREVGGAAVNRLLDSLL